jgi:hypothetical protein
MSAARWSEAQGRGFVRRWRRSGQSMAAFARAEGVDPQRLRYWRERVGAESASSERRQRQRSSVQKRKVPQASKSRLIPGVVVGLGAGAAVTVHLGRGVVVEAQAASELEPTWLAELVRALEDVS